MKPIRAGWRYLAFSTRAIRGGTGLTVGPGPLEAAVVILSGRDVTVTGVGVLPGRTSPFDGLPSALYVPANCRVRIRASEATELALAFAPAIEPDRVAEPILITPEDVDVEIRGAGNATRQINHIITPDFAAGRLEVVEVYTPSGNWSSWPPHKHDTDDMPREAILEEVYSYRFRRPEAWGLQRLYGGSRDAAYAVRHGETVIVRDGYHPFVATHGDDAYYLNALAGDVRTMACSFDPALDRVRDEWDSMEPDARVPLVG
jgi:5-deoxy-glucuronate isomerase